MGPATAARPQAPNITVTLSASPNPVLPDGLLTFTVTASNRGVDDLRDVIVGIADFRSATFLHAVPPPGATVVSYSSCQIFECSPALKGVRLGTLPSGASISFSMVVKALSPPGGTVTTAGVAIVEQRFGYWLQHATAIVRVAGSGDVPTRDSRLVRLGPLLGNFVLIPIDAAFDVQQRMSIVSGHFPDLVGPVPKIKFLDAAEHDRGRIVELEVTRTTTNGSPRIAYSADIANGQNRGGVAATWSSSFEVFTRVVPTAIPEAGITRTLGSGTAPRISYSPASREFLVAWADGNGRLIGQRLDLDGQSIGPPVEFAPRVSPYDETGSAIAWNSVTNEFGLASIRRTDSIDEGFVEFIRVAANGDVMTRTQLGHVSASNACLVGVNTSTGDYIVVWADRTEGNVLGAQINADGNIISRGLVIDDYVLPRSLTFNRLSETFFMVGEQPRSFATNFGSRAAVELNRFGAPLSAPVPLGIGNAGPVVANSVAGEWRVFGTEPRPPGQSSYFGVSQFWGSGSALGGSDTRLGGCRGYDPFASIGGGLCYGGGWRPLRMSAPGMTPCRGPDPFAATGGGVCADGAWLPTRQPPKTVSTGCVLPDPFASIGGGKCVSGGWVPQGMPTPPPAACTIPDPFVSLGGGVCVNGGWIPRR